MAKKTDERAEFEAANRRTQEEYRRKVNQAQREFDEQMRLNLQQYQARCAEQRQASQVKR